MGDETYRELSAEECREMLRPGGIGRVALSVGALPAIFPVRFAVLGHDVVVKVAAEGKVAAALPGAVVAFEADAMAPERAYGWSVLVVGVAELISDAERVAAARAPSLSRWGGDDDQFTRIPCERISGRLYLAPELPAPSA
jgi:nitroimidazol reductase NimA-like FMN-containing flavoprotein (pyridoxamine 5'-phosphate oxidase superfamily)